jgi:DNA-binding IscR family transcriptional regulator
VWPHKAVVGPPQTTNCSTSETNELGENMLQLTSVPTSLQQSVLKVLSFATLARLVSKLNIKVGGDPELLASKCNLILNFLIESLVS